MHIHHLAQNRRHFLTVMALGLLATAGCDTPPAGATRTAAVPTRPAPSTSHRTGLPPIPAPRPGPPHLIWSTDGTPWNPTHPTRHIALTVDDGYDPTTVAAYVEFADRTGIPLTFNPNGTYQHIWNTHARTLAPLIEKGQVQIGNHTYSHPNLLHRTAHQIRTELERNEDWINRTFRITARPYMRPPFGARNPDTDGIAADLGYTRILMWDGTLGDSQPLTPHGLMANARRWIRGGRIVLGHANHPTVTHLYEQIQHLISQRRLVPATLDTLFGTSRATG